MARYLHIVCTVSCDVMAKVPSNEIILRHKSHFLQYRQPELSLSRYHLIAGDYRNPRITTRGGEKIQISCGVASKHKQLIYSRSPAGSPAAARAPPGRAPPGRRYQGASTRAHLIVPLEGLLLAERAAAHHHLHALVERRPRPRRLLHRAPSHTPGPPSPISIHSGCRHHLFKTTRSGKTQRTVANGSLIVIIIRFK